MIAGYEHRFVASSRGIDAPTLLLLHGTGGNEDDLVPLGQTLLPDANLLSPRGNVLENGMPRFFRRLAEGVFDLKDLALRTEELGRFIVEAAGQYPIDTARVIAVGYSNGANIVASLLLRQPERLSAAILLHPMVPFEPDSVPDLAGKPVFISAGRNDPIVPVENTRRLVALLESANGKVTVNWHDAGHSLTRQEATAARDWLASL